LIDCTETSKLLSRVKIGFPLISINWN